MVWIVEDLISTGATQCEIAGEGECTVTIHLHYSYNLTLGIDLKMVRSIILIVNVVFSLFYNRTINVYLHGERRTLREIIYVIVNVRNW